VCVNLLSNHILRVYKPKLTCSCDNRDNLDSDFGKVLRCCRSPSGKPCITAFYLGIRLSAFKWMDIGDNSENTNHNGPKEMTHDLVL